MLDEKTGQQEAVQAASAKLEAIEDFNDNLNGKVMLFLLRTPHQEEEG